MLSRAMPVRNIKHAKMAKMAPKTNGNTKLMSTALNVWLLTIRQLLLAHMNHGYRRYNSEIGGKAQKPHCFAHTFQNLLIMHKLGVKSSASE